MSSLVIIHSSADYREASRQVVAAGVPGFDVRVGKTLQDVVGLLDDITDEALVMVEMQGTVRATVSALLPLRRARPRARFAIVGESGTRRDMQDCAAAGIAGFLLRDLPGERLVASVRMMIDRREFIPASVAGIPLVPPGGVILPAHNGGGPGMNGFHPVNGSRPPDLGRLTSRQKDVLKLVVLGMSNRDIATTLNIAEATVKVHVAAVLRTLGLKTRGAAASMVMAKSNDPEWAQALDIETVVRPVASL